MQGGNHSANTIEKLGIHRAIEPAGVLPQQAKKLDAELPLRTKEILIEVSSLNVDSASFHQFFHSNDKNPEKTGAAILKVIRERGKLQNPITGSGGMLIGTVKEIGSKREAAASATDSVNSIPVSWLIKILSTIKIEFLTTIPNKARIPISAGNDSGIWAKAKMIKTPEIDKGITNMTIRALRNEWNCKTIVIMINKKDKTMACRMEVTDFWFSSFAPPVAQP